MQCQDVLGEANSTKSLGDLYMRQDKLIEAEAALEKSRELFRQVPECPG